MSSNPHSLFLVPKVFLYTSGFLCSYMCLNTECTIPTSSFVLWETFVLAPVMFHLASLACLGFGRAILGDSLMLLYCIGGFLGERWSCGLHLDGLVGFSHILLPYLVLDCASLRVSVWACQSVWVRVHGVHMAV